MPDSRTAGSISQLYLSQLRPWLVVAGPRPHVLSANGRGPCSTTLVVSPKYDLLYMQSCRKGEPSQVTMYLWQKKLWRSTPVSLLAGHYQMLSRKPLEHYMGLVHTACNSSSPAHFACLQPLAMHIAHCAGGRNHVISHAML